MRKKNNFRFIFLSLIIIYLFIFSDIGIIARIQLNQEMKRFEKKIALLRKENEKLKLTVEQLKSDRNYLAEMARKLGYARNGEKIYRFYEEPPTNSLSSGTNIKLSFREKLKFNNYIIYWILFLIVVIIYILLLYFGRNNRNSTKDS
ncbi:MAG: septum formation initiator family protein [bacterium]|nr:septum formation initiator family protein [bacterium]